MIKIIAWSNRLKVEGSCIVVQHILDATNTSTKCHKTKLSQYPFRFLAQGGGITPSKVTIKSLPAFSTQAQNYYVFPTVQSGTEIHSYSPGGKCLSLLISDYGQVSAYHRHHR